MSIPISLTFGVVTRTSVIWLRCRPKVMAVSHSASSRSELTSTGTLRHSAPSINRTTEGGQNMGSINRHNKQDKYSGSCRRVGKMAVLTRCGACDRPVVGIVVRGQTNKYSIECKGCGYSAA